MLSGTDQEPAGATAPFETHRQRSVLGYYLGILRRRIWIVLPVVIIATTLGAINVYMAPRVYRATAKLLVERGGSAVMPFERRMEESIGWDPDYYETQSKMIVSRSVMEIALEHPDVRRIFDVRAGGAGGEDRVSILGEIRRSILSMLGATPAAPPAAWERYREQVKTRHVPETHFIEVAVTTREPNRSALLANAAVTAFERYHRVRKEETLGDAFTKLEQQKAKEELALLKAEQELQAFREEARGLSVAATQDTQPALTRLNTINEELTQVQLERIGLESQIDVMAAAVKEDGLSGKVSSRALFSLPVVKTDATLTEARQALDAAKKDLAILSDTYGPQHPLHQSAQAKADLLREQFRTGLSDVLEAERNRLRMLDDEEATLKREYETQKTETLALAREQFTLTRLQNDVSRHRALYDSIVARMREVDVSTGLVRTNVEVVERASAPRDPVSSGMVRRIVAALILGLVLGVGLAFTFENLDDTVKTPEDLKERLNVPLLGFVPAIGAEQGDAQEDPPKRSLPGLLGTVRGSIRDRLFVLRPEWFPNQDMHPIKVSDEVRQRRGMIVVHEPLSSIAEAYRGIRTSLFYSVPADTVRTLAVTSCRPQEGKTTTCANLALSIAQTGKRVLLIDGDLHRPMLHRTLGVEKTVGLTSVLVGECGWEEAVTRIELDAETNKALHLMSAGPPSPNPSELLGSVTMKEFMNAAQAHYDWVIVDTPPILFVSDSSVISVLCDGVIVVVKAGASTRSLLNRAREQLHNVRASVLGTILNSVVVTRVGRHSSSYYSYGYSRYAKDYKSLYYAQEDDEDETPAAVPEPVAPPEKPAPETGPEAEPDASPVPIEPPAGVPAEVPGSAPVEAPVRPPNPYERQTSRAERLAEKGKLDTARTILESVLALDPGAVVCREKRIAIELRAGLADQAEALSQQLLEDEPDNPYALYVLGSLDIVGGRYPEAEEKLRRSLDGRPDPESMNNLAWLLKESGRDDEAELWARRALELDRSIHNLWDTLGLILLKGSRLDEAEAAFRQALRLSPDDLSANLSMTEILARRGHRSKARKSLKKVSGMQTHLSAAERERIKHIQTLVETL